MTLDQHISKCGRTGAFVSASPEYSFKLQIPGPSPRPTESESLSVRLEDNALYFILLIYFLVFLGVRCYTWAFSSCGEWRLLSSSKVWASHCHGFSCCRAQALGVQASVVACGLNRISSQAPEHSPGSCGAQVQLLRGTWDLPRAGTRPLSLALAGEIFATDPQGKPHIHILNELLR